MKPNVSLRRPFGKGGAMGWWTHDRRLYSRSRFEVLWADLPRVLVLAALPGWGKRTLMLQCASYLRQRRARVRIVWTSAAAATADLAASLDQAHGPDAESIEAGSVVLFVDARSQPEGFWAELEAALRDRPWANAILACYDEPPRLGHDGAGLEREVLHEGALAFDMTELAEIGTLLAEEGVFYDISLFDGNEKGCPALIGQRVERIRSRGREGAWAYTEPSGEVDDVSLFEDGIASAEFSRTVIGRVLRDVRELAAFTVDLIEQVAGGRDRAERIMSRLAVLPVFEVDRDDEAGARTCLWTRAAWQRLRAGEQQAETRARLERGLARIRATGRIAPELRMLLELGELAEAEDLVKREFRSLLIFCDSRTASKLHEETSIEPGAHPMLTLLRGEFRLRKGDSPIEIRAGNLEAFERLSQVRAVGLQAEVERTGRLVFAASAAGKRSATVRLLEHLLDLVGRAEQAGQTEQKEQTPAPGTVPEEANRRAILDACYLGYQAALQVDQLLAALKLGEAMARWGSPADKLHVMEEVCLTAAQDVAGFRSLASDGSGPLPEAFNQARALLDLEEGRDAEALQFVRPLLAQLGLRNSRSTLDALALLIQAITSREEARAGRTEQALQESAELWDDRVPSTFLTWAAITAFASIGAKREAGIWLERISEADDAFADMARMSFMVWNGQAKATLAYMQTMRETGMPRLVLTTWMYAVSAFVQLGQQENARLALEEAWRIHPAPRLFRFALRLIPQAVFERIQPLVDPGHEALLRVFEDAGPDPRTLVWDERPNITRSEHEILQMLAAGDSNAEIAEARFIALGTLRTHLKSLYRKLGASNRAEALTEAVRFELINHFREGRDSGERNP